MKAPLASLIDAVRMRSLLVVLALAALVRVGLLLALPLFRFEETDAIHGSEAFDLYARHLLSTGVYGLTPGAPDAQLPPLYSYVVAFIYAMFGRGGIQIGLFHTALDLSSIVLLYHIGRNVFTRRAVATLAALFYAVYPYLIFQNLTLIDTPLFMTLMYAFLLAVVLLRGRHAFDSVGLALALVAGIALGLATLTRPILPPLALLVAVWFLFKLKLGQTILSLLPVALVSGVLVLPWVIRNTSVYGEPVLMSLTTGSNFYQGNNPDVVPFMRAGYDVQWTGPESQQYDPNSPAGDRERLDLALQYLSDHPEAIPELLWVKFLTHWSIDVFPRLNPQPGKEPRLDYHGDALRGENAQGEIELGGLPEGDPVGAYSEPIFDQIGRVIHRFYFGALLLLALVGIFLSRRHWRDVSLLWFAQISMTFVYVLFHPSTRYRVPTDPLLFLFSAYTLMWVSHWLREQPSQAKRESISRYGVE